MLAARTTRGERNRAAAGERGREFKSELTGVSFSSGSAANNNYASSLVDAGIGFRAGKGDTEPENGTRAGRESNRNRLAA